MSTAHVWMRTLNFRWRQHTKCVYVDGHNRPDFVDARREYVAKMLILRQRMAWSEPMERTVTEREGSANGSVGEASEEVEVTRVEEVLIWPAVKEDDGKSEWLHVAVSDERDEQGKVRPLDELADGVRLLPDEEVLVLQFQDECTWKENDDGGRSWEDAITGAAIKKGEGRAVHASNIIGMESGRRTLGHVAREQKCWGANPPGSGN